MILYSNNQYKETNERISHAIQLQWPSSPARQ
jgi:hypothetical protein